MTKGDVYRIYVFDEMTKRTKRDIKDLEKYVDSLSDDKAKKLCRSLSHSRKNGVYEFIDRGPKQWTVKTVNAAEIYVRRLNDRVNGHLSRNHWSLEKISEDKEIPKLREFKKRGKINKRSRYLLAHKRGDSYRLVDGNHRAIRLACDGEKEFKLILPKK